MKGNLLSSASAREINPTRQTYFLIMIICACAYGISTSFSTICVFILASVTVLKTDLE